MRETTWNFLWLLVAGVLCIVFLGPALGMAIALGCACAILVYTVFFRARE